MLVLWIVVMALSPSAGCVALTCLAPRPDLLTAVCGAVMGMVVSVCVFVSLT